MQHRPRLKALVLSTIPLLFAGVLASTVSAQAPARNGTPVVTKGQKAPPARMGPVIVDPPTVDFGVVGPNTKVEAEVALTNATDKTLLILASVPSCQCTSVDMKGVVIKPGETVPMPMSMKTSASTGIKVAGVTLMFQGHPDPVQVTIRSEVAYSVRAQPPFIDIQQSPKDAQNRPQPPRSLTGTISLESLDGAPFRVVSVHGKAPVLANFDPAKDDPRSSYEMVYDFRNVAPRDVPSYLIVETDRPDCPVVDIRIRHEATHIRPNFKIGEFRSSFGALAPGSSGQFDIELKEVKTARVAKVASKDPSQASVAIAEQKSDGENLLLTVDVTPAAGHSGLVYFPVALTLTDGRTTDLLVFGLVRP